MVDRFFISPSAAHHVDVLFGKVVELLMDQEIPPPFYVSCDVIGDNLVVGAMPEYDYNKFLKTEAFTKMVESAKIDSEDIADMSEEDIADMGYWLLASVAYGNHMDVTEGSTAIMSGNIEGCRIYASSTLLSDLDKIRLILKAGLN